MREVQLLGGHVAFVDDEDYDEISRHRWGIRRVNACAGIDTDALDDGPDFADLLQTNAELLEALKRAKAWIYVGTEDLAVVTAAIAKAEGR